MSQLDAVLSRLDAGEDAALDRLVALLRIPSISTDPAHEADCRAAAKHPRRRPAWDRGFDASLRDTSGHPMVVGHNADAGPDAPHYLFYGHYDVQPVDPLDLWESDPFEPQIVARADGSRMIRARGAQDDKGQLMTFTEACRAWKTETGALPCRVTVFLEGEEESGSASLPGFLDTHGAELKADAALVCDTEMWSRTRPAICTGLRGLMGEEVIIKAADMDLHSGTFGGPAQNPIRVLARILAGLHDDTGRVTLRGFYDGVPETPAAVKAQWETLNFSTEDFLGAVGLSGPAGERDRTALEQIWARPTCEFNGISGGYTGEGFKTVLPAAGVGEDQLPPRRRSGSRMRSARPCAPMSERQPAARLRPPGSSKHGGSGGIALSRRTIP